MTFTFLVSGRRSLEFDPTGSLQRRYGVRLPHTILTADDNVGVRRSLRTFIEQYSAGDVCGEAENGAEAVEKVKQLHPDVVILDYSMPLLDGLRAAMQIRSLAPETKIILFTVYAARPRESPRNDPHRKRTVRRD